MAMDGGVCQPKPENHGHVVRTGGISMSGKQLFNVPKEQLRLATRYDAQTGPWAGFGVGVGATYQSPLPGDSNNSFFTPSSTVWDAQLSYQSKSVRYGVHIANLWDSKHFVPSTTSAVGRSCPQPLVRWLSARW